MKTHTGTGKMSKYNLRRSPQFKHILLSSCQIRKNNIDGNREANLGQRRLRRKGCLGEGRCGEREREGEGRGAKWKNESHERKERRQAENCKAFSSTRFGPRTVSQRRNINAANDRVHPQTHTRTAPAIVDGALASLLLKSLKPRGIEEKTQLCVFF